MIPHFITVYDDSGREVSLNVNHIVSITPIGNYTHDDSNRRDSDSVEIEDTNKRIYRLNTGSVLDPTGAAYEIIKNQY